MSTELIHYGIHGQKWGIRRFQYADGSLTPAGKARYYKTPSPREVRRNIGSMSSDELNAAMERINADRRLRDISQRDIARGAAYVASAGAVLATSIKSYNNIAKIVNTFGKTEWKVIS